MEHDEIKAWIGANRLRADDAYRCIYSAKKQRISEYDERLRKLKQFAEVLYIKAEDTGEQGELFDVAAILPEEIDSLLKHPLRGLD